MKIDRFCPLCGNNKCTSHWACVSDFLMDRMFRWDAPKDCRLQHCQACDFYFFDIRPDDKEIQRFYEGYRDDEYQHNRQKYEKSYSTEFNSTLGAHPIEIANRIAIMEQMMSSNDVSFALDVLDYGGNEGRLIPESVSGAKYCYDLSGAETVLSVTKLTAADLGRHAYGLIMLQHVLEHIPYPVKFLKENIYPLLNEESFLYIELPYEIELVLPMLARNRTPFYSFKNRFKLYRPSWFLPSLPFKSGPEFHEHINGFSLASLTSLLAGAGLEKVDAQLLDLDAGWCQVKILICLARKARRDG